jgi:hypothetical protein
MATPSPLTPEQRLARARSILDQLRRPFAEYKAACNEADQFLAETETADDQAKAQARRDWPEHYQQHPK